MSLEIDTPIFFTKESEDYKLIKQIIKDQGFVTCRNDLPESYISACFQTFTHGIIIVGKTAALKNYGKKSTYMLKGFDMFTYDEFSKTIIGKIVCGREIYKGTGAILMNVAQEFALEHQVGLWQFNSLPHTKLVNYYKNFGFKEMHVIYDKGKVKVIAMAKTFKYEFNPPEIYKGENCDGKESGSESEEENLKNEELLSNEEFGIHEKESDSSESEKGSNSSEEEY